MKLKSLIMVAFAFVMLSGCSYIEAFTNPSPNVVATLQASLAAAETGAMQYVNLPLCGTITGKLSSICSEKPIIEKIGKADMIAYKAVMAARANVTTETVADAQNAIKDLNTVINDVVTK